MISLSYLINTSCRVKITTEDNLESIGGRGLCILFLLTFIKVSNLPTFISRVCTVVVNGLRFAFLFQSYLSTKYWLLRMMSNTDGKKKGRQMHRTRKRIPQNLGSSNPCTEDRREYLKIPQNLKPLQKSSKYRKH
uniref:Uncharacterized protein n=1 Tax=Cacopsylla melanoneura TaxID=428564 RepID=A0A8D8YED7_9HEMI